MSRIPSLDLAVVGNGALAALVDKEGRMVWCCWPRLDGDPIFCALIDGSQEERGLFAFRPDESYTTEQQYERNTAILRTVVTTPSGSVRHHRFCAVVPYFRAHAPPADDHPPHRAAHRTMPVASDFAAAARLWRAHAQCRAGLQPYQLRRRRQRVQGYDRRVGQLCAERKRLRADPAAALHSSSRRNAAGRTRAHLHGFCGPHP